MSDEDRRRKERKLKGTGAPTALDAARANAELVRRGLGVAGFLGELLGVDVFIEGIRINYRGVLLEVLIGGDGKVEGLKGRWQRVSYFNKGGPDAGYTYTHAHECVIPYDTVHLVGREGFVGCSWAKVPS